MRLSLLPALLGTAVARAVDRILIHDASAGADYAITPEELDKSICRRYIANLTQSSTGAPVATVLYNTLGGTVDWTRSDPGEYVGTLSGAFSVTKTNVQATRHVTDNAVDDLRAGADTANTVSIKQTDGGTPLDGLTKLQIHVEVYP